MCRVGCGDSVAPLYSASCLRTIVSDSFSNAADSALLYVTFPLLPFPQQQQVWAISNSSLVARPESTDSCKRWTAAQSIFGFSPAYWSQYYLPWGSVGFSLVTATLDSAVSTAGLVVRLTDASNYYAATLSVGSGLQFIRVSGGQITVLARVATLPFNATGFQSLNGTGVLVGVPLAINVTFSTTFFFVSVNGIQLISGLSDSAGPTGGSVGVLASGGPSRFNLLSVSSTCNIYKAAQYMSEGMRVSYTCLPGYVPIGNSTWTCNSAGSYGSATLTCLSLPPTFSANSSSFAINERSPNGTLVGAVQATPANPMQVVSYALVKQVPFNASRGFAFSVTSCSGAIRVLDPFQLNYAATRTINLTISAMPDGQVAASAYTNVTIFLNEVPQAPYLLPTTVYVNETFAGPVSGPIISFNPNRIALNFSLVGVSSLSGDAALFSINARTGVISVSAPGLLFAKRSSYDLVVRADLDSTFPTFSAASLAQAGVLGTQSNAVCTVYIIDVPNAPTAANQTLFVAEGQMAMAGDFIGVVTATSQDTNPVWSTLFYSISANAVKVAENVGGALTASSAGPLFSLSNSTGAIAVLNTVLYSGADPVFYLQGALVRDNFAVLVSICGGTGLCTVVNVNVVVAATNVTVMSSIITGFTAPQLLRTVGGEFVQFTGNSFPIGAIARAQLILPASTSAAAAVFAPTSCFVASLSVVQCTTPPGWGVGLLWKLYLNNIQVPSTAQLTSSYAPPVIESLAILDSTFSTAGSTVGALELTGTNFGGASAPISIIFGNVLEFSALAIVSHSDSSVSATLGPGCGADLPVVIVVGGQSSGLGGSSPALLSYPPPTLFTLAMDAASAQLYDLSSLPTSGGVGLVFGGSNFGPAFIPPTNSPMAALAIAQSGLGSGPYSFGARCVKDDLSKAHTRALCTLQPGISTGLVWSIKICGQSSNILSVPTAFAAPVLVSIGGEGSSNANTAGGQTITLTGSNFFFASAALFADAELFAISLANPPSIDFVSYGAASRGLPFSAQQCKATSSAVISCLTGQGTGRDHSWQVSVGGQLSVVLEANTSYAPPVILSFGGSATGASTDGGSNVTIFGGNLGPVFDPLLDSVTYTSRLGVASDFSSAVPGDGVIVYNPQSCTMTVPHTQLVCVLAAGGGRGIVWSLVVDGQISTAPTTSFSPPIIANVSLVSGRPSASSDGGEELDIFGTNFGAPGLLQRVAFGQFGVDYHISGEDSLILSTQSLIRVRLMPCIAAGGLPLRVFVTVADQASASSEAVLAITPPLVVSISPPSADGDVSLSRPTLITLSGYGFGLLDASASVAIAFGAAADSSLRLLTPVSRSPTLDEVSSPGWVAPPSPALQQLVFALPLGLGANRAIRVIPYRAGRFPSSSQVAAIPPQGPGGADAFFSYTPPYVDYVVVAGIVDPAELAAAVLLFGGEANINGTLQRLTISGSFFGPAQSATLDGIARIVEEQVTAMPQPTFSSVAFAVSSWSTRLVTVYSYRRAASIRVRISALSPDGLSAVDQVSGVASFSDVSPFVSRIVGQSSQFSTAGGARLTFLAGGLSNTIFLNVSVGSRPCPVLDPSSDFSSVLQPRDVQSRLIAPQGGGPPFAESFQWSISCVLPEGEGIAPVVIVRDGVKSDASTTVAYAAPTVVSGSSLVRSGNVSTFTPSWTRPNGGSVLVPTESAGIRTVRLEGINFGLCPSILVGVAVPIYIDACIPGIDVVTGAPTLTPNPNVVRSHTFVEFSAPDGVGTGLDVVAGLGWSVALSVAGQFAPGSPVPLRYRPPSVMFISPASGPTVGSVPGAPIILTLQVANIGPSAPTVALGSQFRTSWLPCLNVTRISNAILTCALPAGSGAGLAARLVVADQSGSGGAFSYLPPLLTRVSLGVLTGKNASANISVTSSINLPIAADVLPLEIPCVSAPQPQLVIVLEGTNFGPREASENCVFVSWASRNLDTELTCTGEVEDFLGEGQVPAGDVLEYGHFRIVVRAQPGAGRRDVSMRAGGQAPAMSKSAPVVYMAPHVTGPLLALSPLKTDGGGRCFVPATNVPRPPWPVGIRALSSANATSVAPLAFPFPLPLLADFQPPTEGVAVFIRSTCMSSAVTLSGAPAPGTESCSRGTVISQVSIADSAANVLGGLTFVSPPGVGANKSLTISVFSNGQEVARSNAAVFSYDAPVITGVSPWPVYQRPNADSTYAAVSGFNFGRSSDETTWAADELVLSITVGSSQCAQPARLELSGRSILQCQLSLDVPVGHLNVSVNIAGQTGFLPASSPSSFFVVCAPNLYAFASEVCLPCPMGASCDGFIADATLAFGARINASLLAAGPVRRGRLQYEQMGVHSYPRSILGWYNLNSSDANTAKWGSGDAGADNQMLACPPGFQANGRDVCIAPCSPPESCKGDNLCAYGYASKPPSWKCSSCDIGFYHRNTECIKCPDSPWALVIGFTLLVVFAAAVGYFLSQKGVNIAVISIGLDFFQVLAIFASSGVKWPAVIKELLNVLSAFNLNIEIVAPECIVPNLSYKAKFYFIMLLPLSVGGLLLGFLFWAVWAYKALVMGQARKEWFSHAPGQINATLSLLYVLYLYLTRTVFDVFNCTPTFPPDGRLYLSVADHELCGIPGGTQLTLLPYAVAGLFLYSFGYPAFVAYILNKNRELCMLDQLLRAKGVGEDRLTNPQAFTLRLTYGRQYFQFKPDFFFWILAVILRKFFISITAVVFSSNSSFQMAACLLVMFLAYSAQTTARPYMSPGEYEGVLKSHAAQALRSATHARLRDELAGIETRGKKRGRKNLLTFEGRIDRAAVLGVLTNWLFNYNTVEQIMIFCAVIVCLMGIMYQANTTTSFYPGALDGVTAVVMITIIFGIVYYFSILTTEMVVLYNEEASRRRAESASRSVAARAGGSGRLVDSEGKVNTGTIEQDFINPFFMNLDKGSSRETRLGVDEITQMDQSPNDIVWRLVRDEYVANLTLLRDVQKQLNDAKKMATLTHDDSEGTNSRRRAKREFSAVPQRAGGSLRALRESVKEEASNNATGGTEKTDDD